MSEAPHRDIVLFSSADWASKYWTNKQHIAARLAARGHRVLYVETVGLRQPGLNTLDARRIAARLKRGLGPIRKVRDNLWTLSPLTIPFSHSAPGIRSVNSWQLRLRIQSWLSSHNIRYPLVWTYHPYMLDVVAAIGPSRLIYHCVDDLGAIPGIDRIAFRRAEHQLLMLADAVFTTSHHLQQRCEAVAGRRAHYFGNVADIAHFAKARTCTELPPDLATIATPRLGYIGALSDFKVDFGLLDAVAGAHPQWHVVLIGEEREGQRDEDLARLAQRPNVHLLGWKPYDELPRYLAGFDVALLPQRLNDYTRAMFPMKFFEYLAAGRPIVSTPLDALRDLSDYFKAAATPHSFANAIAETLDALPVPLPVDAPILQHNSWDHRLDAMLAIVDGSPMRQGETGPVNLTSR